MAYNKEGQRVCNECGKLMQEGYMIEEGLEHYCCDECLHKHYTQEEYLELYDDGNGATCYTEWHDEGEQANSDITKLR